MCVSAVCVCVCVCVLGACVVGACVLGAVCECWVCMHECWVCVRVHACVCMRVCMQIVGRNSTHLYKNSESHAFHLRNGLLQVQMM